MKKITKTTWCGFALAIMGLIVALPFGHNTIMTIRNILVHHEFRNPDFWRHLLILAGMLIFAFGLVIASLQVKDVVITFSKRKVFIASYILMLIPTIVFFLGILKPLLGLLFSVILLIGFCYHILKDIKDEPILSIQFGGLVVIIVVSCLWVMLTGIGGFALQRADIHWRNVYLHDFSNYTWPVSSPELGFQTAYYWTIWLLPGLVGKVFGFVGANITMYIYASISIILTELLVCSFLQVKTAKKAFITILALIFFGGVYIIGALYCWIINVRGGIVESFGWADGSILGHQFTNPTGLLLWVYNQTIIAWLATALFLNEKQLKSLAFLGLCIFPTGPFPFVGFFFLAIIWATAEGIKYLREKKGALLVKDIFSIPNICAIVSIFFVFLFFFKASPALEGEKGFGWFYARHYHDIKFWIRMFVFCVTEFLLYAVLIYKENKRDILFWALIVSLVFIPFIRVGSGRDFAMRACIPGLFVLYTLILKTLFSNTVLTTRKVMLIICLVFASESSISDIGLFPRSIFVNKKYPILSDGLLTTIDKNMNGQFAQNAYITEPNSTVFYKYLARRKSSKQYDKDAVQYTKSLQERGIPFCEADYIILPKVTENVFLNAEKTDKGYCLAVGEDKQVFSFVESTAIFGDETAYFDKYKINLLDKNLRLSIDESAQGLQTPNNSNTQKFYIQKMGDYCKIICDGKVLTYNHEDDSVGFFAATDSDSQLWHIEKASPTAQNIKYASWLAEHPVQNNYILKNRFIITDWLRYYMDNSSRYTTFLAVRDEAAVAITDEVIAQLHALGMQQPLKGKVQHGYVAVIDRGTVVYERMADSPSNRVITSGKLDNGLAYHIESAGLPAGNFCSIIINGQQQAVNHRGLNFVVYDNELGKIVDSVAFDTWAQGMPCYR